MKGQFFQKVLFVVGVLKSLPAISAERLRLESGYVYRIQCQGRLLVSAVGDDRLVRLEALPKEMGCAAILKPLQNSGQTNLILETSAGTILQLVELAPSSKSSRPNLEINLSPGVSR